MRAWQVSASDSQTPVIQVEMTQPVAGPGQVLVRVQAAGVTPTELLWYPTTHTKAGQKRSGAVPGHEFSGTIAAVGSDVDGLAAGQDIFGMNDWFTDGATAEYCVTEPGKIAKKPTTLSHAEAATVPIGALTAWQGLFDRAKLQAGERVLIHGGSGAVGIFAVQLAARHGAHVITTASKRNQSFLIELGAERVIDYQTENFAEMLSGIDVVFDAVGGQTLQRSWQVLSPGGRLVTIAAASEAATDPRVNAAFFIVEANQKQLTEIAGLLEAGALKTVVNAVVPFSSALTAYGSLLSGGLGRGKVVVAVHP
jgi:NADPH:quinone reductase-like Zn-dependent oxidoreductase